MQIFCYSSRDFFLFVAFLVLLCVRYAIHATYLHAYSTINVILSACVSYGRNYLDRLHPHLFAQGIRLRSFLCLVLLVDHILLLARARLRAADSILSLLVRK
jgi:hypothetical protein